MAAPQPYVELFPLEEFIGIRLDDPYYVFYLEQFLRYPFYKTDKYLIPYILTPLTLKAEIHNHPDPIGWNVTIINGNTEITTVKNLTSTFEFTFEPRKGENEIRLECYDKTGQKYETIVQHITAVDYLMPSLPFLVEIVKNRYHIEKLLNYSVTNTNLNSIEIEETWGQLGARDDIPRGDSWESEIGYRMSVRKYLNGIYGKKDTNRGFQETLCSLFNINPIIVSQKDVRFEIGMIGGEDALKWRNDEYLSMGRNSIGNMPVRSNVIINNGFDII